MSTQQPTTGTITEFKSIKWVAYWLFYVYKLLGVCTIPLISILYIVSTTNIMSGGAITDKKFELVYAVVYGICFEMNGLRLIIDARCEQLSEVPRFWIDYGIGTVLVTLGTISIFLDGLVNAGVVDWKKIMPYIWIVLIARSVSVIAMVVRECVHYAPLLLDHAKDVATHTTQKVQPTTQQTIQPSTQTNIAVQNNAGSMPSASVSEVINPAPEITTQPQLVALPAPSVETEEGEEETIEDCEQSLPDFIGKTHTGQQKRIIKTVPSSGETARKITEVLQRYKDEGKDVPTQGRLAKEAECSRQSVIRYYKALKLQS